MTLAPRSHRMAARSPSSPPARTASRTIWIRPLDAEEARPLAGTEGATDGIWSPDSRFLAFASGGKLKKIEATGGPAQTLCDATSTAGGVWTSDNRILFGAFGPLQIVSSSGGTPTPLTTLDHSHNDIQHVALAMLPDGHHFLYVRVAIPFENGGVYIGSLDAKPEQQGARKLLPDTTGAVYVPSPIIGDGPASCFRARLRSGVTTGTLMAQPLDPKRMELMGDAVPIAERVIALGVFGVSRRCSRLLHRRNPRATVNSPGLTGKATSFPPPANRRVRSTMALSPDGRGSPTCAAPICGCSSLRAGD